MTPKSKESFLSLNATPIHTKPPLGFCRRTAQPRELSRVLTMASLQLAGTTVSANISFWFRKVIFITLLLSLTFIPPSQIDYFQSSKQCPFDVDKGGILYITTLSVFTHKTSSGDYIQDTNIIIRSIKQLMQGDDYHFKFKVVILGDKAVGKTAFLDSISQAFGKTQFSQQSQEMTIKSVAFVEQQTVYRINYWQIPSRVRNAQYTFRYSLGCTAAIYLFDVTKRNSFDNVEKWLQINEKAHPPLKVLVGNKVDLYSTTKNTVSKAQAQALARKHNIDYFETCSIGDTSITPIFDYLFTSITSSIPNPPTPQSLVGKGVLLGKKLINSPKYHLALCEIATLYE